MEHAEVPDSTSMVFTAPDGVEQNAVDLGHPVDSERFFQEAHEQLASIRDENGLS